MMLQNSLKMLACLLYLIVTPAALQAQTVTPDEARAIAREAYVYAYAPIASYQTWSKQATEPNAPEYAGGFNTFRPKS